MTHPMSTRDEEFARIDAIERASMGWDLDDNPQLERLPDLTPAIVPVHNIGEAKRILFYRESDPTEVLYLVADQYAEYPHLLSHPKARFFPLEEPYPKPEVVEALLRSILADVASGKKVAVACMAGVNRSASTACLVQMHMKRYHEDPACLTLDDAFTRALKDVWRQRPIARPMREMADTFLTVYERIRHELPQPKEVPSRDG